MKIGKKSKSQKPRKSAKIIKNYQKLSKSQQLRFHLIYHSNSKTNKLAILSICIFAYY